MANQLFIPMTFMPVNTGAASNSYTVPAGKYAQVTITLTTAVKVNQDDYVSAIADVASYTAVPGSTTETVQIWLSSGDALTSSTSVASGTGTAAYNGTITRAVFDSTTAESSCSVLLNGTTFMRCRANGSASILFESGTTSGTNTYANFTGAATVDIQYSEFNNVA